jgi:hypothetical protein
MLVIPDGSIADGPASPIMESVAMSVLDRMKSIKYREGFKKEVDSAQMPFAQRAQIQDKNAHDTGK